MTEVLLMAVTAVRELTLLPGDTAICKEHTAVSMGQRATTLLSQRKKHS